METVCERLRRFRTTIHVPKLTQSEFGSLLGKGRDEIGNWEYGRTSPDESDRMLICHVFGLRRQWLDTGEGEPYDDANLTPRLTRVLRTNPALEQMLRSSLDLLTADDWRILNDLVTRIVQRSEKE